MGLEASDLARLGLEADEGRCWAGPAGKAHVGEVIGLARGRGEA